MADPATYRPAPGAVPDAPGVYRFRDPHGRVVYVGKAKSLRSRLASYFQDLSALHPRTQAMVTTASSVDWVTVGTEVEALQLEYTWIKEFDPRYNVRYRDDKSYPYLAVTLDEEYPRITVMRGQKRKGVRYFGPYSHAWAIRETVDLLLRVFPARTCSAGVFKRHGQIGRPCLLGYIGKCSAPCTGQVSAEEHRRIVEDFVAFLSGQTTAYTRRIEREMKAAASELDYERAARLRDDLRALERALEKNAVVLGDGTDADVIGLAEDELEAAVQVFHVRGGRIRGQRGFVVEKVEDVSTADLVEHLLQQLYGDQTADAVPREILVPAPPTDEATTVAWLEERRGTHVEVRVPQRGDKKDLLETVTRNAEQALVLHKTRRAGDLTSRSQALEELQEALGLAEAPLRIECVDVSHLQGTDVVASLVVFEDGLARKSEYRRFSIRGSEDGISDDTRSIAEVVTRRFRRLLEERHDPDDPNPGIDPVTGKPRKFAYPPQLFVVDGGQPQVEAAQAALSELGVSDVAIVGLAKRLEEVWLPGDPDPVILPRTSEGLYLLQRVRDEAHRFAITYQRQKRGKRMVESILDDVPGLGEARKKALLRQFGSLKRLRAASLEELESVPGIGPTVAQSVLDALAASAPTPAVNMATGEILD
ncbi:MAG TPA: excinuclease ABC subunit UvrC [Candidatus Nanopelagicales bacterium]|nr:excinuclease ABC subunit UvrC [Candidatus Nanopelagicales bacterium]